MNNEEKILSILGDLVNKVETLDTKVETLAAKVDNLEQGQTELKQDVTKIKVTLENETNRNIQLLREGHTGIVEKLDGLPEMIIALQDDTAIHRAAIHELARRKSTK